MSGVLDMLVALLLIAGALSLIGDAKTIAAALSLVVLLALENLAASFDLRITSQLVPLLAAAVFLAWLSSSQREMSAGFEQLVRSGSSLILAARATIDPALRGRLLLQIARSIATAVDEIRSHGGGATIIIERETGMEDLAETGVMVHAEITPDLLFALFMYGSRSGESVEVPTGASIIRGDIVLAAYVPLPIVSLPWPPDKRLSSRDEAALGVTIESDALAIVVNETTGLVSVVERARLIRTVSRSQLEQVLVTLLRPVGYGRHKTLGRLRGLSPRRLVERLTSPPAGARRNKSRGEQ